MSNKIIVKHAFDSEPVKFEIPYGSSVRDIVELTKLPLELQDHVTVLSHGFPIQNWDYFPSEGENITLCIVPMGGGGGIFKPILQVVVAVAAVAMAMPTGGLSLVGYLGATGAVVAAAAFSMVATMAINALIPPPAITPAQFGIGATIGSAEAMTMAAVTAASGSSGSSQGQAQSYNVGGQSNTPSKYGPVPKVYGRMRMYPNLASTPLIASAGDPTSNQNAISALYDFGTGDLQLTEMKIGNSPASFFEPEIVTHQNTASPSYKYLNKLVSYDQQSIELKKDQLVTIRTAPNSNEASVTIEFPQSLYKMNEFGHIIHESVDINMTWKNVNTGETGDGWHSDWHWAAVNGSNINWKNYDRKSISTTLSTIFPKPGTYDIFITRKTENHDGAKVNNEYIFNRSNLTMVQSFRQGKITKLAKPHTLVEMRVKSGEKVSGVIDKFSAIAESILWADPVYDATTDTYNWTKKITRNPAWIVADILCGDANRDPLSWDQLDVPSFIKLAAYCDEEIETTANGITEKGPRYTCDIIVDYTTTVKQLVSSVLSQCRSQLIISRNGKYGVFIDEERTTPKQLFSPANSWGFNGIRPFTDRPHALKVKFINPALNWQMDECIVYDDGYSLENATDFEELSTFGITSYQAAWRYGRYMIAQGVMRSELFTINCDVENLVCQRGDMVLIQHDVPKVGGFTTRISEVSFNALTLADTFNVPADAGYTVRLQDGSIRQGRLSGSKGDQVFLFDEDPDIKPDDLITIGSYDTMVEKYIISQVMPGANLTAELTLVKYDARVYHADVGNIPDWKPIFSDSLIDYTDLTVHNLTLKSGLEYRDRWPSFNALLEWTTAGNIANLDHYDIFYKGLNIPEIKVGETINQHYNWIVDYRDHPDYFEGGYFKVVPISKIGTIGQDDTAIMGSQLDTKAPEPVDNFGVNIQSEQCQLFWDDSLEEDAWEYHIRFSPKMVGATWNESQKLATVDWKTNRISAGARTGTFMIKVMDSSGNFSKEVSRRTTVSQLPNINLIDTLDEFPAWPGTKHNFAIGTGGKLQTAGKFGELISRSEYYLSQVYDLGDVYESRVSNMIQARGEVEQPFMSSWTSLSAMTPSIGSTFSDEFDVWLEYRTSDTGKFIKDWVSLATVPVLGTPADAATNWSNWRKIIVGDVTARFIQFRIIGETYNNRVKATLLSGTIIIDMPDRVIHLNDQQILPGGTTIAFSPPFKKTPAVAVTIDGLTNKPLLAKVSKDSNSVTVSLVDMSAAGGMNSPSVAGQVDIAALGYGVKRTTSI